MTLPPQLPPVGVVAQITGQDLLDRFDKLTEKFTEFTTKLDDIPTAVHDHENRLREIERKSIVTWPQMLALCTVFLTLLGVVATFLAVVIK